VTKQQWLDAAEVADAWRLVPRIIICGYGLILWNADQWFQALEAPSTAQQFYINVIWGAAMGITAFYLNTGRKWG
jgi:hypothetical protein